MQDTPHGDLTSVHEMFTFAGCCFTLNERYRIVAEIKISGEHRKCKVKDFAQQRVTNFAIA